MTVQIPQWVKDNAIVVIGTVALIAWLDLRFMLREEILTFIYMKESTRYAEVCTHYLRKLRAGEPLEPWEEWRLDLCQREQGRIHEMLTGEEHQ